jgi:hypothetical protein
MPTEQVSEMPAPTIFHDGFTDFVETEKGGGLSRKTAKR